MKYSEFQFPYPVLGTDDNIASNMNFSEEIISDPEHAEYEIKIIMETDNPDILSYINKDLAEYTCEILCSATLYRKIFRSSKPELTFSIPKKDVRGKVEFTCMIVAKDNIPEYYNDFAHPDYQDYAFNIEKGDILAFFQRFSFSADIDYQKLKAVTAFMEIEDGGAIPHTIIDLDNPKIVLKLPSEDYFKFASSNISKEEKFTPIIHSSIVYSTIIFALNNINDFKDRQWAQVIEHRVETEADFKGISLHEKLSIPDIAQRLLGNPISRLLDGLNYLIEQSYNEN